VRTERGRWRAQTQHLEASQTSPGLRHRHVQLALRSSSAFLSDLARKSHTPSPFQMPELNLPDKMPESFEEGSAMVVKLLGPVEELSPFKLGQIQKLIEDT